MKKISQLLLFLISLCLIFAANSNQLDGHQIIEKITIRGLEKHSSRLVRNYIPIQEGDVFTKSAMQDTVRSLFASNFFKNIKLYQNNNELIIDLVERAWIAQVIVTGNELIDKEQLETILESQNIIENRAFNDEKFSQLIADIESTYYLQGYYGVKISVTKTFIENNRVNLKVDIYEGEITRIARINLVGNTAYTQEDLQRLFQVREDSPENLFDNKDSYIKTALDGDLQRLSNFYQNRGYARFQILDRYVSLLPDKTAVLIQVHMQEGAVYNFADINVNGYEKVLSEEQVKKALMIKSGETFSREKMLKSVDNLRKAIQSYGYAFVRVNPIVKIDDRGREVFVNIQINTGQRVYVRRVIFSGNNVTLDEVIRTEMRQFEQALYIPQNVELSKQRINRLGFFSQLDVNEVVVNEQQVDLIVRVNEKRTGSFNTRFGYSPQSGVIFQLTIAENNWLGRGNQMQLNLGFQENSEEISVNYTDRHFFEDDVSLSWRARYKQSRDANNSLEDSNDSRARFNVDEQNISASIGMPASENLQFNYGLGLANEKVSCGGSFLTCQRFIDDNGDSQNLINLSFSGQWDLRNRGFLPSRGSLHNFSNTMTLRDSQFSYYTSRLQSQFYGSLNQSERSTLRLRLSADTIQGYNGEDVPFYKRLFVGGSQTVRGYRVSSLGPRYVQSIDGVEGFKGGTFRTYINLDFYIALNELDEFSDTSDNFRLNLFADSGHAFDTIGDFDINDFSSSSGVGWVYFSPIGVINIFYAITLNEGSDAQLSQFGFQLGGAF